MQTTTDKYINPLTDFGFKKLFGSELNKELLIDFLNQIIPNKTIQDLTYSATEHLGNTTIDRKAIFDLYCVGTNGEHFIVEMQKAKQNFFKDRSVFYASFPIQQQAKKGNWNYQLTPVYSIGILDFIFNDNKGNQDYHHIIELKDQHCTVFYDKLKFIYIELPKFNKSIETITSSKEKWMYALKHLSNLQDRPKQLQERVFKRLFEIAELAKFTPQERVGYETSLKYYRDLKNVVDISREEGKQEGFEQGKLEQLKSSILGLHKNNITKVVIAASLNVNITFVKQVIDEYKNPLLS